MAEVKKTTAATVKADIAKTAAELAEGSKKTVEEVKKTATKAAETVKKATAKKAPAKKATATKKAAPAKKATAAKKPAAKKVEAKVSVNLQYGGLDVNIDEIIKKVKKAQKDCKKYEIYVKPEEGKAYYVADGQLGDVQL